MARAAKTDIRKAAMLMVAEAVADVMVEELRAVGWAAATLEEPGEKIEETTAAARGIGGWVAATAVNWKADPAGRDKLPALRR